MRRPLLCLHGGGWVLLLLLAAPPSPASAQEAYSLDQLLQIAREQSPTLEGLRAERAAAAADRRAAGRWPDPELEYEWGEGDPFESGGSRRVGGFSFRQTLENPFSRHFRLDALDAGVEAAEEDLRLAQLDLDFEVRSHYYRILFLTELLRLARLNEEALSEIRTLIEVRAAAGEVRELEAIRLRVEHLRARNEVEAAQVELSQFRRHLNTFLGDVLPPDYELAGALTRQEALPSLEALEEENLPHHPSLALASRQLEAARATARSSSIAWFPSPTLSGGTQRELDGKVRSFGIGFEIPLWGQSRAAHQADRQRVRALERQAEALRLELEAQLLIHHNRLRLADQTVRLFEEGLNSEAEASIRIAEASYRAGEISLVEYLDARRTYRSIQIEYQQALYDWNVERAALERAAGGGTL